MTPAHEIPVYRPKTVAEAKKYYENDVYVMSAPQNKASMTDDELRAAVVCFRRPDHPLCENAEKVKVIVVLPPAADIGGISADDPDAGCVALESRKIAHLRQSKSN